MGSERDFLKRLMATFKLEAAEHVKALSSGLIELEKASVPDKQAEITEVVFREAHSLKGAARSVNVTEIEELCQSLESVFAGLKRNELSLSSEFLDVLHLAVDNLNGLLPSIERERTAEEKATVSNAVQLLNSLLGDAPLPVQRQELPKEPAAGQKPAFSETVRVSTSRLESLLLQTEELLSAKLAATRLTAELRELNDRLALWEAQWAKTHPDIPGIRHTLETTEGQSTADSRVAHLVDFLDWNANNIKSLQDKVAKLTRIAERDHHFLEGIVDGLMQETRNALVLPVSWLLEALPKFARDLSREQGKDIKLTISGEEIEIDRRILEEMKDPLLHLVRNCVDHGIEKSDARVRKGKLPQGTIAIAVSQKTASSVEMLVADDGAGIDLPRVREAAVKRGIITSDEAGKLNEQQTLSLVYHSGVSTSPIITDISGRGLGLAIVQEKVEKVHGTISVETQPDSGTTFRIVLPLTVATFRGVVVRVGEHLFVVPTTSAERAVRVNKEQIKTVENRETISLDGRALSFVRLADVLELPAAKRGGGPEYLPVLVLTHAEKSIAFLVDEIAGEQEVLVKSLGPQLSRVRNVIGVSVLATGKMAPVLNVVDLAKSAVNISTVSRKTAVAEEPGTEKHSILVVEDSITARVLLKNILEAAGYTVKTAVDGVDALASLKTENFDLVVSDVDMPRMNGFELTAKIRADKRLAELPVVLVTALEAREHRERGVDVGANAYIVKSSLDQSNLVEVIGRLI